MLVSIDFLCPHDGALIHQRAELVFRKAKRVRCLVAKHCKRLSTQTQQLRLVQFVGTDRTQTPLTPPHSHFPFQSIDL